jgi:hypothetical protein
MVTGSRLNAAFIHTLTLLFYILECAMRKESATLGSMNTMKSYKFLYEKFESLVQNDVNYTYIFMYLIVTNT